MPKPEPNAEDALRQLGQRLRDGYAKQHQSELQQSLETVKDTVREEWEKDQQAKRSQATEPQPDKTKDREPEEPER